MLHKNQSADRVNYTEVGPTPLQVESLDSPNSCFWMFISCFLDNPSKEKLSYASCSLKNCRN